MSKMVIYQLLPRIFSNYATQSQINGSLLQNGVGKLNAINRRALKALANFGVTHIWYTGIHSHATQTDYSAYGLPADSAEIVKGKAGSPYAIRDYYDVDPDLADRVDQRMEEFEALIERTHQNGLSAIIDFVPNHVARQYSGQQTPEETQVLGVSDRSDWAFYPQNNFYYLPGKALKLPEMPSASSSYQEIPAKATGNDVFSAQPALNDWYETIKLNYGIDYLQGMAKHFSPMPDTWKKMAEILLFWASKGVDGFRCDMVHMVPLEFWQWVIPHVKRQYPKLVFIAELYQPELYDQYLDAGFNHLYDKVGLYDTLRSILTEQKPLELITHCWQQLDGINDQMLRFLENHDEQRIASRFFLGDPFRALPAFLVTATMHNGPVLLYAGQEVGETAAACTGFSGDDGRTSIFDYTRLPELQKWTNQGAFDGGLLSDKQKELRQFYQELFKQIAAHAALKEGQFYDLMWVNRNPDQLKAKMVFAYLKKHAEQLLLVVANFDPGRITPICLRIPVHAFEWCELSPARYFVAQPIFGTNEVISFQGGAAFDQGVSITLPELGCAIWQLKENTY